MNSDNIRSSMRTRTIFIIVLFLIIIVLSISSVLLFQDNQRLKEALNKKLEDNDLLSEEEAKKVGIELYDKATEIYEVYNLNIPYCGEGINELKVIEKTTFSDELSELEEDDEKVKTNTISYYKSKFKNMDALKTYLGNFLIDTRVNEYTKVKPLKDLSLLTNINDNNTYDYILNQDRLYCRIGDITDNSRYIKKYTNEIEPYDIKTVKIRNNKITFIVTSKYLSNNITNFDLECKNDIDKCITTVDQSFSIEKIEGTWLVSMFSLHE